MSDLVERLRGTEILDALKALADESAMEIESLREALEECALELDGYYRLEYPSDHPYHKRKLAEAMAANPARVALGDK